MKCLILIVFFMLYLKIISCDEFHIVRNRKKDPAHDNTRREFLFTCITDSINDAIVWNTNFHTNMTIDNHFPDRGYYSTRTPVLIHHEKFINDERSCGFNVHGHSDECNSFFMDYQSDWKLTKNSEVPMGPVFDRRWEGLEELQTLTWSSQYFRPVPISSRRRINLKFDGSGAFVVSVRGVSDGHFFICTGPDYRRNFCYWIIIGGWGNTVSVVRKCRNGVTFPPADPECGKKRSRFMHHPLNINEWKTFVITWNAVTKTIRMYDPDVEILSYTDSDSEHDNILSYHIFYGTPSNNGPIAFRFHEYEYKLTTKPETQYDSMNYEIDTSSNGKICIDMVVGLCSSCELHVRLVNSTDNKELARKIISGSTASAKVQHGLPMWQNARIIASHLNGTRGFARLEIITKSTDPLSSFHWALGDIRQCLTEGTMKSIFIEVVQSFRNGTYGWPDLSCQRLSHDKPHAQIINPMIKVTSPPENVTPCREQYVGPKCDISCYPIAGGHCISTAICNVNQCYCTQGYTSDDCWKECTREAGEFGYDCRETCDNCRDLKCTLDTGRCTEGCKKLDGEYQYVPPFCKDTVRIPELKFDQIDSANLRVYFPRVEIDKKFNITYGIELKGDNGLRSQRYLDDRDDNGYNPIYSTVFDGLNPGMKYRARLLQRIQYRHFGLIEKIRLDGDFSKHWTMCIWTGNFTIERGYNNLTIERIDREIIFPCPDHYYSVTVLSMASSHDESSSIVVRDLNPQFPMRVVNLLLDTNYTILITGLTSSFQRRRVVRTLSSNATLLAEESAAVRDLEIFHKSTTDVAFKWHPPKEPNSTSNEYHATIKVRRRRGCELFGISLENFTDLHSYNISNTYTSYFARDLEPYVDYQLTISTRPASYEGISSINFTTNYIPIPTAVYTNLTFKNGKIEWNISVAECLTVTGPLEATRLFFFGVSENVKDFKDEYVTREHSFTLDKTKKQGIHGCEQYRVRIHALRSMNGSHNESAYNELVFTTDPYAPDPPGRMFITKMERGVVNLFWEHPPKSGGPVKNFIIHIELIATKLRRPLRVVERNSIVLLDVISNDKLYKTQLKLLPSTNYKINIRGVVICPPVTLIGNSSSDEIQTPPLFGWYKDEPRYIVHSENYTITLFLPRMTHETWDSKIYIIVIGKVLCEKMPTLPEDLAKDIELKKNETAWHVNSFSIAPTTILIGGDENDDNMMKCALIANVAYVIAIVVRDDDVAVSNQTKPFIWRSRSIYIIPRTRHEIWAIPLLLLIIIGLVGIIWFFKRTKKRRVIIQKNSCGTLEQKVCPREVQLTPISEERYTESKCETIVKLDKFQEYVKCAIASGKLEIQYSRLSSNQMKSGEDGLLSEHASGDREHETAVTLKGHPGNPYFKCLNAHYINGYKKHKAYIVLQGPQPSAIINFWCMVWQERVDVICMLSDIVDAEQMKRDQYWPELGKLIHFGSILVCNISRAPFADYTFSTFEVKCNGETRRIDHLHYTAWPDYGVPLYTQSVVTFMRKLVAIPLGTGPVIVHCNAGVGRTGAIVLFDICHRRANAEGVLDVFGVTDEIRRQRPNMVDNKQQYTFTHVALVECLVSLSTAIPCDDSLAMRIKRHKNQLSLQQERLEQSVLQDKAIQFSMRSQLQLSAKNIAKNRFPDSLPITRLYIPRYPTSDDDSSYISGVYVDSARRRNSYIASQLPMSTTVTDFWRMIAAFKVELIIILQRPDIEDPTCCNFVPKPNEKMRPSSFLDISGKSVTDGEHFLQQKIVLIDESTRSPREKTITVLTCKGWNPGRDKSPPKPATLVELWRMAEGISRHDDPTVVLCHDGIHGCGLYLALSLVLERMGLEHECDVCFAIRAIRRSRSNFCRTKEQFGYLYNAALLYAAHFDAYANFK